MGRRKKVRRKTIGASILGLCWQYFFPLGMLHLPPNQFNLSFRTFADYWAEIFGTNPIDDVVAEKVKSEAAKFKMKLEEEQP